MSRRTIEIAAFLVALLVATLAFYAWLASQDEQQRLQSTLATQKQIIDAADARERTREVALKETLAQIEKLKRAAQTPAQIVRDLPKYLPFPQPITLVNTASSAAFADRSKSPAAQQGTDAEENDAISFTPPSRNVPAKSPAFQLVLPAPQNAAPCASLQGCTPPYAAAGVTPKTPFKESDDQNREREAKANFQSPPCAGAANCAAQIPAADLKPLYNYVQDCRACQAQLAAAKQNSADDAAKITALTHERDSAITAAKGGTFWRRLRRNALWFAVGAAAGYAARKRSSVRDW